MTIHTAATASAELFWFKGTLVNIHLSSTAGVDGIFVMEHWMPYGESPPLHIHRNEDEVFHILEGTMRFRVGGEDTVAYAGQTVLAPKGVPHSFRVESPSGARCLTITRGSNFETLIREMSEPAPAAELPPHGEPTPEMIKALTEACERNGIDIVGPPIG
jgi:mannose-6-phosphate isomerase-like protein (cupin superfamily)